MSTEPRFPVTVELIGQDGNIFSIMARVARALRNEGATPADIEEFKAEVFAASSYDEALTIIETWVEVE